MVLRELSDYEAVSVLALALVFIGCGGPVPPADRASFDASEVVSRIEAGTDEGLSTDAFVSIDATENRDVDDAAATLVDQRRDEPRDEATDCSDATWLRARVEGPMPSQTREFCRTPIDIPSGIGQEWMGARANDGVSVECQPRRTSFAVLDEMRFLFDGEFLSDGRSIAERSEEMVLLGHYPQPDVLITLGFDPMRIRNFSGRCTVTAHDVSPDLRFGTLTLREPCVLRTSVSGPVTPELLLTQFELRAPIRHVTDPPPGPFEPPIDCPTDATPRDR